MADQGNTTTLVIERIFDAPVELVWKAWTNEELFKKWWGPKDFTAPHANINPQVGEKYLVSMRGPAGSEFDKEMWSTGVYKEIIPMEKIVVTDSFADEHGNVVPGSYYGMGDWPLELEITVTFEQLPDGRTKMTLHHQGMPEGEGKTGANQGWNQSFDKLEMLLAESR